MKKILIYMAIAIGTFQMMSCKKTLEELGIVTNTPILLSVDQYGIALVQLPNGGQVSIPAIVIPAGTTSGIRLSGQCIITAPPIKPIWDVNNYGQYVASGFYYNEPDFTAYTATAWVVECYKTGNVITGGRLLRVTGSWGHTPNPGSYVSAYQAGTLNLILGLGYAKTLSVEKFYDYPYVRYIIN